MANTIAPRLRNVPQISALALAAALTASPLTPALAADTIFSSSPGQSAGALPAGRHDVASGATQIRLDDGTIVGLTAPASFEIGTDGSLTIPSGSFTIVAPASGSAVSIRAGDATLSLEGRSGMSGRVSAAGAFSGFVLSGNAQVSTAGGSRAFAAGSALQASGAARPSAVVTAGVQQNQAAGSFTTLTQAQLAASQYLPNPIAGSPSTLGTGGVALTQNPAPVALQSVLTAQQAALVAARNTEPLDPSVALAYITEVITSLNNGGTLGQYQGLSPTQIQALLSNLSASGAPSTISQFQLQQFLQALGAAGYSVGGITGSGPSLGSIADLFALLAAGGTIAPGDVTIQALIDQLADVPLPPGIDEVMLAETLIQAGYSVPPGFGGSGNGNGNGGMTPPTPALIGSGDNVQPDSSRADINLAYAILTQNRRESSVTVNRDANGLFSGYTTSGGTVMATGPDIFGTERYVVEYGGDQGVIGYARVAGGDGVLGLDRGLNGGNHYVWTTPLVGAPTAGLFSYQLISATSPTVRDSSLAPGTFTGAASVRYDQVSTRFGLDGSLSIGGSDYAIVSQGGLTAPSLGVSVTGSLGGTIDLPDNAGPACNEGDCRVVINGSLGGSNASHMGIAYTIRDDRSNNTTKWIDGAAAFRNAGVLTEAPNILRTDFRGGSIGDGFVQPTGDAPASNPLIHALEVGVGVPNFSGLSQSAAGNSLALTEIRTDTPLGMALVQIGTASNVDSGAFGEENAASPKGVVAWTRWSQGSTTGTNPAMLTGNQSQHFIYGAPYFGNLPTTGRGEYLLVGGTRPTSDVAAVAPGTFSGELAVDFATAKVGWETLVSIGTDRFNFNSEGGLANPGIALSVTPSGGRADFTGTGSVISEDGRCVNCTGTARGFLTGRDGGVAGLAYTLGTSDYGNVSGVAAFEKLDTTVSNVRTGQTVLMLRQNSTNNSLPDIETFTNASVTLDGASIDLVNANTGGSLAERNLAASVDQGSADGGDIVWNRWSNGSIRVNGGSSSANAFGSHLISFAPATNVPTSGVAQYNLVGGTQPVSGGRNSEEFGTMTGGIAVAFGATSRVGVDLQLNFANDGAFNITTPGGLAGAASSPVTFFNATAFNGFGNFTFNSGACSGGCQTMLRGELSGDGAGFAAMLFRASFGNQGVYGAGVFQKAP